jgi:hypothetical protein
MLKKLKSLCVRFYGCVDWLSLFVFQLVYELDVICVWMCELNLYEIYLSYLC